MFGLLTGELFETWAAFFLKYTLVTSAIGLFFPLHDFMLVKSCSMLSIFVSGMAILAWRMSHLSGIWRSIFALNGVADKLFFKTLGVDIASSW